jgi:hypothetical protein
MSPNSRLLSCPPRLRIRSGPGFALCIFNPGSDDGTYGRPTSPLTRNPRQGGGLRQARNMKPLAVSPPNLRQDDIRRNRLILAPEQVQKRKIIVICAVSVDNYLVCDIVRTMKCLWSRVPPKAKRCGVIENRTRIFTVLFAHNVMY